MSRPLKLRGFFGILDVNSSSRRIARDHSEQIATE